MNNITARYLFMATAVASAIAPVHAQAPATEYNSVAMEIRKGSTLIGRPTLVLPLGGSGTVTVDGKDGFQAKVGLDRAGQGGRMRAVDIELYTRNAGRRTLAGHPIVTIGLNNPGSVTMTGPAGDAIVVKVTVEKAANAKTQGREE